MKILIVLLSIVFIIGLAMLVYHQHEQRQRAEIDRVIQEANESMALIETQHKRQ